MVVCRCGNGGQIDRLFIEAEWSFAVVWVFVQDCLDLVAKGLSCIFSFSGWLRMRRVRFCLINCVFCC